jgi:histone-lysine N-methyltransferase SETMAR
MCLEDLFHFCKIPNHIKMNNLQIRTLFLHEFKQGHNATEAAANISKTLGDVQMPVRTVQNWFAKFRAGNFQLENEDRGRPPLRVNDDELRAAVEANPHTTVRQLAETFEVAEQTISNRLKAIGKKKKLDSWVPHELSAPQKATRMQICLSHLDRHEELPFLHRIVTCDEKWVEYDNRTRRASWVNADEPRLHHAKPNLHQKKAHGHRLVDITRNRAPFFPSSWHHDELGGLLQRAD